MGGGGRARGRRESPLLCSPGSPVGGYIRERCMRAEVLYCYDRERERGYESCERCTRECSVPRGYDVGLWGIGEMDGFEVAFKGWRMSMTR